MNDLLVMVAAGITAWSMRASAILLARGRTLPAGAMQALAYAKHAVLAGLIGAALAGSTSPGVLAVVTPQTVAATVAAAVAWRTRGVLRTLLAGVTTAALVAGM